MWFENESSFYHPHEVQTISPKHRSTPAESSEEDMGTCHGRSVLSFSVSLVFGRWTSSHWSSVAFVCHPVNHHCQNPVPLYSRRAAHPKEGLDIQLATVTAPSVMRRLATCRVQIVISLISITYSIPSVWKGWDKVWAQTAKQLLFSVLWCDVTFLNNSSATSCHACHWNALMIPALQSWQTVK